MRKDFAPDIVLGFDVGTPDKGEPNSYLRQLELLVTEHQTKDIPYSTGMRVHVDPPGLRTSGLSTSQSHIPQGL